MAPKKRAAPEADGEPKPQRSKGSPKKRAEADGEPKAERPPKKAARSAQTFEEMVKQVDLGKDPDGTKKSQLAEIVQELSTNDAARKAAYAKLGRALKGPDGKDRLGVPPAVLARFTAEKNDERKKFVFLAEFMMDPTWASITLTEEHYKACENKIVDRMNWKTINQIAAHYNCDEEAAKELCKDRPSMPNPDAPTNPFFTLYRIFGGKEENDTTKHGSRTNMTLKASVDPANAKCLRGVLDTINGENNTDVLKESQADEVLSTASRRSKGSSTAKARTAGSKPTRNLKGLSADEKKAEKEKEKVALKEENQIKEWIANLSSDARDCLQLSKALKQLGKKHLDGQIAALAEHSQVLRSTRDQLETLWADNDRAACKTFIGQLDDKVKDL